MVSHPDPPAGKSPAPDRSSAVDILCRHYALDNLDERELERRLDVLYRVEGEGDMRGLLSDLPALPRVEAPVAAGAREAPARGVAIAVMGGTERKGNWIPPRKLVAVAAMGGVELDFREARFAAGVSEVMAVAFWGGVEIVVPPGIRVESNGIALMGGFDHPAGENEEVVADAPVLRIGGVAFMGGVEISTRYPGETKKQAARRRKLAREARRRLR